MIGGLKPWTSLAPQLYTAKITASNLQLKAVEGGLNKQHYGQPSSMCTCCTYNENKEEGGGLFHTTAIVLHNTQNSITGKQQVVF